MSECAETAASRSFSKSIRECSLCSTGDQPAAIVVESDSVTATDEFAWPTQFLQVVVSQTCTEPSTPAEAESLAIPAANERMLLVGMIWQRSKNFSCCPFVEDDCPVASPAASEPSVRKLTAVTSFLRLDAPNRLTSVGTDTATSKSQAAARWGLSD